MSKLRTLIAVPLILVVALAIGEAALAPAPAPKQPDFVDTILASKAVVAAIRLAIVFAAAFVALSVVALVARRQWLSRVGPIEVEKVSDLDAENHRLEKELDEANRTIESLKQKMRTHISW